MNFGLWTVFYHILIQNNYGDSPKYLHDLTTHYNKKCSQYMAEQNVFSVQNAHALKCYIYFPIHRRDQQGTLLAFVVVWLFTVIEWAPLSGRLLWFQSRFS